MSLWLNALGAEVWGYALPPAGQPNLWDIVGAAALGGGPRQARGASRSVMADIRDPERLLEEAARADPNIVIHMAAQALVPESYRDPLGTFATNVMGTAALLQACRSLPHLQCVIVVTSDKVYENHGEGRAFGEGDRLGGEDPYSSSKACAELLTSSLRRSFFAAGPPVATVRAGNVIGGGDWSQDRLIPDCMRAIELGHPVNLRYPDAVRPWQHVLEPLSGYLALAQGLVEAPRETPRAVNFGPDPASFCTVREVVDAFASRFGGRLAGCGTRSRSRRRRRPSRCRRRWRGGHSAGARGSTSQVRCRGLQTGIRPIRRGRTWWHFPRCRLRGTAT